MTDYPLDKHGEPIRCEESCGREAEHEVAPSPDCLGSSWRWLCGVCYTAEAEKLSEVG